MMIDKFTIGSAILTALLVGFSVFCMIYADIYYVDADGNKYEESHPTRVYEVYKVEFIQVDTVYNWAAKAAIASGLSIIPCAALFGIMGHLAWRKAREQEEIRQREAKRHRHILEAQALIAASAAKGLFDTAEKCEPEEEPNRFDNIEL